ncbi:hypothetical protein F4809DRAFT_617570 [Biscogniauxia mediterranea]|nr:hypothetical protein F4809DRAFT_617570 [Biscogniauxia mediterranea]
MGEGPSPFLSPGPAVCDVAVHDFRFVTLHERLRRLKMLAIPSTTAAAETPLVEPSIVARQVTLTQTITYADYTTTAVVTLARGDPPSTDSPASTSNAITQQQTAIIIGISVTVVVLILLLWLCYVANRHRRALITCAYNPNGTSDGGSKDGIIPPPSPAFVRSSRSSYYPAFPHSIPPPVQPIYRAVEPANQWSAYEASHYVYNTDNR